MISKNLPDLFASQPDIRDGLPDLLVSSIFEDSRLVQQGSLQEAFCKIENGEVVLHGMHIAPYEQGNRFNVDPLRPRKLLLKKSEIRKIERQLLEKGFTLVPLKLYFSRGYAKLNIGLARGKKLYDKREAITAREVERSRRREEAGKE